MGGDLSPSSPLCCADTLSFQASRWPFVYDDLLIFFSPPLAWFLILPLVAVVHLLFSAAWREREEEDEATDEQLQPAKKLRKNVKTERWTTLLSGSWIVDARLMKRVFPFPLLSVVVLLLNDQLWIYSSIQRDKTSREAHWLELSNGFSPNIKTMSSMKYWWGQLLPKHWHGSCMSTCKSTTLQSDKLYITSIHSEAATKRFCSTLRSFFVKKFAHANILDTGALKIKRTNTCSASQFLDLPNVLMSLGFCQSSTYFIPYSKGSQRSPWQGWRGFTTFSSNIYIFLFACLFVGLVSVFLFFGIIFIIFTIALNKSSETAKSEWKPTIFLSILRPLLNHSSMQTETGNVIITINQMDAYKWAILQKAKPTIFIIMITPSLFLIVRVLTWRPVEFGFLHWKTKEKNTQISHNIRNNDSLLYSQ